MFFTGFIVEQHPFLKSIGDELGGDH